MRAVGRLLTTDWVKSGVAMLIELSGPQKYALCSKFLDEGAFRAALDLGETIQEPEYRAIVLVDAGAE